MVDLSHFRLSKLNTPEYRHFILLLFWPLFGITFYAAEQLIPRDYYHPMYHPVDDLIPFQELFVIPYLFWFVFLIGANVYTALWEPKACVKMMKFTIFTYGTGLLIFALFPTCQQLRPEVFPRENLLTGVMGLLTGWTPPRAYAHRCMWQCRWASVLSGCGRSRQAPG